MPADAATFETASLALPNGDTVVVCLPTEPDAIAIELRAGRYELPAAARLVLDLVHSGTRLLDLGAHLGTVTLAAAAKGAQVLAIDASPRNVVCLRESAHRNRVQERVAVRNVAVGDREGTVAFHEDGPYGQVTTDDDRDALQVPERRADALVAE